MVNVNTLNSLITLTCLTGLGLSIYAYFTETYMENDPSYSPMCDISERVSCSKAFNSKYGKGFGIFGEGSILHQPNSLTGILFYSLMATLAQSNSLFICTVALVGAALSNLSSLYFAYILYFRLYVLCIICVAIYGVNFVNLFLAMKKFKFLRKEGTKKKE